MLKLTRKSNLNRIKKLKLLLLWVYLKKLDRKPPRCWVNNLLKCREQQGHYDNLVQEMRLHESLQFFNYHRMSVDLFDELLHKVGPAIEKLTLSRKPISTGARLSLTLRYLASGDSMKSLSYNYRVSPSSTTQIISETCQAIWDSLFTSAFERLTEEKWKRVANDFYEKWNFPNCIEALDGKHCVVQAFPNSGSACFNYKGSHSIILMALCDADYNFLLGDIGASGRFSDSGVFKNTCFGKALCGDSTTLNIPNDEYLPGSTIKAPFVILGDEAFPLFKNLMRPFPGRNRSGGLPVDESTYNYRLSRARRVIENSFGVLSAKWRVYRRPILANRETVVRIVKSTICLHNWIKNKNSFYCSEGYIDREEANGQISTGRWRQEISTEDGGLIPVGRAGANNSSGNAIHIRNNFKRYFVEVDVLP